MPDCVKCKYAKYRLICLKCQQAEERGYKFVRPEIINPIKQIAANLADKERVKLTGYILSDISFRGIAKLWGISHHTAKKIYKQVKKAFI